MERKEKHVPRRVQQSGKAPKQKKKSRLTTQQKILVVIAVLLAIALVIVLAWKSLFVKPEVPDKTNPAGSDGSNVQEEVIDYGDGVRPKVGGERKSEDFYTILILGRDTGGGGNTDTMLLASYDVTNQKATVMSIPRDTMVNVSWDVKKINSVYNVNGGGDKGIKALYKEIAQLVGFEPDYQVVVEWDAVGKIVDAIGGVYFDVPYDMDYHDPYQDLIIEQAKGYRLLTGDDAMQVIRWRQNDNDSPYGYKKMDGGIGDSGRMKLQQDFLKAVIKQLLTPANIKNISKISKVFQESVETDLMFQEILWFGKAAVSGGLSVEDVEFLTMPWTGVGAWSRSYNQNLAYVVPIRKELLSIVNEKLSPFVDAFTLADLDIMYVNSDGSIGSTSGHVEDRVAAQPPVKPEPEDPETTEPIVDENGNVIDPETGLPIVTDPESEGSVVVDPETDPGTTTGPGTTTDPGTTTGPGEVTDPDTEEPQPQEPETPPEEPVLPAVPETPDEGGFIVVEPPPEG